MCCVELFLQALGGAYGGLGGTVAFFGDLSPQVQERDVEKIREQKDTGAKDIPSLRHP